MFNKTASNRAFHFFLLPCCTLCPLLFPPLSPPLSWLCPRPAVTCSFSPTPTFPPLPLLPLLLSSFTHTPPWDSSPLSSVFPMPPLPPLFIMFAPPQIHAPTPFLLSILPPSFALVFPCPYSPSCCPLCKLPPPLPFSFVILSAPAPHLCFSLLFIPCRCFPSTVYPCPRLPLHSQLLCSIILCDFLFFSMVPMFSSVSLPFLIIPSMPPPPPPVLPCYFSLRPALSCSCPRSPVCFMPLSPAYHQTFPCVFPPIPMLLFKLSTPIFGLYLCFPHSRLYFLKGSCKSMFIIPVVRVPNLHTLFRPKNLLSDTSRGTDDW